MLFEMPKKQNTFDKQTQNYLIHQCKLCPLKKEKSQEVIPPAFDLLIISEPTPFTLTKRETGFETFHTFNRECGPINASTDTTTALCCMGRKLDLIASFKPKLVVVFDTKLDSTIGKTLETALGFKTSSPNDSVFPAKYKDHTFWCIKASKNPFGNQDLFKKIKEAMKSTPCVETDHYSGLVNVLTHDQMIESFKLLSKSQYVACDVETYPLKVYAKDAVMVSMALSNGTHTFSYPLFHPQTPNSFPVAEFFVQFNEFAKNTELIFHNSPFDQEWIVEYLDDDFLFSNKRHDTMAQAYLLNDVPNRGKSLNELCRKHFGFDLKELSAGTYSSIDDLRQVAIESVLKYNGLDAKYTYKIFFVQKKLIEEQKLPYDHQIDLACSAVLLQRAGLPLNEAFIEKETLIQKTRLDNELAKFNSLPEVQLFKAKNGGVCNPQSPTDMKNLFYNYLNVPKTQESIDDPFLQTRKNCPVSLQLMEYREVAKLFGTYIAPISPKCGHHNAGKQIWPDGKLHASFNVYVTATGRLSSDSPNMQNWPKRDGNDFMREAITAPPGHVFVSIDFGQIEYRVIAALSKDPVMIDAILNGLDIHGWWANRLDEMFPGMFLKKQGLPCTKHIDHSCACDKCEFKAFRNKCKNGLVFPLCFGSLFESIGENMGIADNEAAYKSIGNEFWSKHKVVNQWQENLLIQMNKLNYIENAFGRRYRGPLKRQQIINYPIQGTASDIVTHAMVRLCKLSVKSKIKFLQPRINIHDDLCFFIPEESLNDALAEIIPVMLDTTQLPFMPVPLLAEVAVGTHWANTKEIGTFSSQDLYGIPYPLKIA